MFKYKELIRNELNSIKRNIEILDENDSNNIKVSDTSIFNVDSIICGC